MAAASSNLENTKSPSGVYKNPRLMHVCTTSIGYTVQLQHKDGSVWEGIFSTFSESFTVCLDLAVPINPKLNSKDCLFQALKDGSQVKEQAFFDLEDIVRITVIDVDMTYATKESDRITTDADISGFNPNKLGEHRQLESWIADEDECDNANADSLLSLDEVAAANKSCGPNSRGWDAQDMFRYNERVHKVSSTYDEKLQDYTIALPRHSKNDRDWRKKQERAAAIAREIENNPQSVGRLAKEDASDNEEEKFSAVLRPTTNQPQSQQQPAQAHPRIINQADDNPRPPQQQTTQTHQQPAQAHTKITNQADDSPRPPQQQPMQSHQQPPQQPMQTHQQPPQQPMQTHQQPPQQPMQNHQQQPQQPMQAHQQPTQQPMQAHQQSPQQPMQTHQQPTQQQHQQHQRPLPNRINNGTHKNFRPVRSDRRLDSLKNFGKQLNLAPPTKDQSEIVRNSKLNPNAKEFVYKPRTTAIQPAQTTEENPLSGPSAVDPANPSPMSHASHGPYYQQVPIFPHGLSPQQQHHAAQFMPNHAHMHFQSQIHYMPAPMAPHFAQQQTSPRYIRGNFQNYHHRGGDHMNNVRTAYSQASMIAPTSAAGQPYIPQSGAPPHPMGAYATASPQQPMIYSGPPQSVYPMVQAGFPLHMSHVANPPPYDGQAVYMPPNQNYVVNP